MPHKSANRSGACFRFWRNDAKAAVGPNRLSASQKSAVPRHVVLFDGKKHPRCPESTVKVFVCQALFQGFRQRWGSNYAGETAIVAKFLRVSFINDF